MIEVSPKMDLKFTSIIPVLRTIPGTLEVLNKYLCSEQNRIGLTDDVALSKTACHLGVAGRKSTFVLYFPVGLDFHPDCPPGANAFIINPFTSGHRVPGKGFALGKWLCSHCI